MKKREIPFTLAEEVIVDIIGYGGEGQGVGRYEGFTVFVPGTLVGELVKTRIIEIKKRYALGEIVEILEHSPARIEPPCTLFDNCGGCQLLHMDYQEQLNFKKKRVQDTLERLAGLKDIKISDIVGMQEAWYYRNKVRYPLRRTKDNRIIFGCYQRASHRVVETRACLIQKKDNLAVIRAWCDLKAEQADKNLASELVVKSSFSTGEMMLVLIGEEFAEEEERAIARKLRVKFPQLKSILVSYPNSNKNSFARVNKLIEGRDYIMDSLLGLEYKVSASSFTQVNPLQTEILYKKVLDYAQLTGQERVLDAYCGIGLLSLFLAREAKEVYGIEINQEAIDDAQENARLNNMDNLSFIAASTESVLPQLNEKGESFDLVVLNPPRTGCREEVLEGLVKANTRKIIYISCNPATLARDLKYLSNSNYHVEAVQAVDNFPHTYHVECVTLMSKVEK